MPTEKPSPKELEARRRWFEEYCRRLDEASVVSEHEKGVVYPCPCCYCLTLCERGGFEICPVCYWEDDGQDDHDAEIVRGGPNRGLSLTRARSNYAQLGACDESVLPYVRSPRPDEKPNRC